MRRVAACALLVAALATQASAAPDPVVARDGAVTVTAGQLRAMLTEINEPDRSAAASDPASLTSLLRGRVLQDLVYNAARAAKWDRRPDVAQQAERARQGAIVRSYIAAQLPAPRPPTEADIARTYEANKAKFLLPRQFHLAQIFLATAPDADAATLEQQRRRLADLRPTVLANTAAFAAAAKKISMDKRSASAGGDLGWLRQDAIAEPVRGIAMGLQEGSVSDPIRTADGWHLIELLATRPAGPAPLDQMRPAITRALLQQQQQADTTAYLNTLLQRSPVQVDEAALKRLAEGDAK